MCAMHRVRAHDIIIAIITVVDIVIIVFDHLGPIVGRTI